MFFGKVYFGDPQRRHQPSWSKTFSRKDLKRRLGTYLFARDYRVQI